MKAVEIKGRIRLAQMPFDRWDDDKHCHIHATGDEVVIRYDNGEIWGVTEYEDSDFDELPLADDYFEQDEEVEDEVN